VLEVEVIGDGGPQAPARPEVERIVGIAFASAGVDAGHVAVEYVDADRIASLNREFRGRPGPTDVLSFPVDGDGPIDGPPASRELGDIVICPAHTEDLREAVLHGALHLTGMDHETDDGEMLALQAELLTW
jgi:probable rRNA maturation factor